MKAPKLAIALACLTVLMMGSLLAGCSAAKPDSQLVVCLGYNAGTPYEWTFEDDGAGVVELVSTETENLAEKNVLGGPMQDVLTFEAKKPGTTTLSFTFANFVEPSEADGTSVLVVKVDDKLNITVDEEASTLKEQFEIGPIE